MGATPNPYAAPAADVDRGMVADEAFELASRWARLGAALLDLLVGLGPMLLFAFCVVYIEHDNDKQLRDHRILIQTPVAMVVIAAIALVLLFGLGIFQMYRVATSGQTLGKKWVAIRIVRTSGQPVGFVSGVLLRMIVPGVLCGIPILGLVFWLVDALFIFRADRRCLHDLIAETKVVEAPES